MRVEQYRCAKSYAEIEVMTAGMHDPSVLGSVFKTRLLLNGQTINVSTQRNHRTGLFTSYDCNKTSVESGIEDFNVLAFQDLSDSCRSAHFVIGKFRVDVKPCVISDKFAV